jgi:hypothetical protein
MLLKEKMVEDPYQGTQWIKRIEKYLMDRLKSG